MKILIVAENASLRFGGEAAIPVHLFRGLRASGVDVKMIVHARVENEVRVLFPEDGARFVFIPDTWLHKLLSQMGRPLPARLSFFTVGLVSRLYTAFSSRRIARQMVKQQQVDLIHQPIPVSPKDISLLFGMGVPVVMGPMNGGMSFPPAFSQMESRRLRSLIGLGRILSNVLNWLVPGKIRAAVLLVANDRTRRALPYGVRGNVKILVENGVDASVWTSERPGQNDQSRPVRFIFMGRLVDWKAVDLLIRAVKLLQSDSQAELYVVGDGSERAKLESLAKELGIADAIKFLGWKSQAECAQLLRESDVFCLPSLMECGGAVVLEAMCAGLPVIATDWGGPADYIDKSCGILVRPDSSESFVQDFASSMLRLAQNPLLRRQMGEAGRKRVIENFDWKQKIDQIIEVYKEALASSISRHDVCD
jgi:glycosyltransferase involved in cell wall biosynthesis